LVGLGRAIRARRYSLQLSQEGLANLSGIDRSHMGKIERGERNITLLNIERVAAVLQVLPSQLLAEAGY
jgi:transcriptional regulator with XRE-family HTH domain